MNNRSDRVVDVDLRVAPEDVTVNAFSPDVDSTEAAAKPTREAKPEEEAKNSLPDATTSAWFAD